jgi:serine/threonine protein phosphatase PrpC
VLRATERSLAVSIGQWSVRGRDKAQNQDFHGAILPEGYARTLKGVAIAVADGISTSPVGHVAAETAVKSFLTDYYCTSDAWSVRTSGESVISSCNAWLYGETRRSHALQDLDRGYVCTFSALVLKGSHAHLFHVGDSRIWRLAGETLEPLTEDHRVVLSSTESYLGRALGVAETLHVDHATTRLSPGDVFVLTTDGAHEHVSPRDIASAILGASTDLTEAARRIAELAAARGSADDITVQIVRVDHVPEADATDFLQQADLLPLPPEISPPAELEGFRVQRELHASDRSRVYLATDPDSGVPVVLKVPGPTVRSEPALLRQFLMEEWVARRVSSPHLARAHEYARPRGQLYAVMAYAEGMTLRQWMNDNPRPGLEPVRDILDQVVKGLRALHRREMIHCDLRPENVLVDRHGTVTLVDFGSVRVAGLAEAAGAPIFTGVLGSVQYTAPECLAGEVPTWRSDLFSVAVIGYEMLTGRLPFGADAARVQSMSQLRSLRYRPARSPDNAVPDWIDGALRRAAHPDPARRYEALSEFVTDLREPNPEYVGSRHAPLLDRDPVRFWKSASLLLAVALAAALLLLARG